MRAYLQTAHSWLSCGRLGSESAAWVAVVSGFSSASCSVRVMCTGLTFKRVLINPTPKVGTL